MWLDEQPRWHTSCIILPYGVGPDMKARTRKRRWACLGLAGGLVVGWLAAIEAAYYILHKPFGPETTVGIAAAAVDLAVAAAILLDRWWEARRTLAEPTGILEAWKEQGITHVLLNREGMDFIRAGDSRYSAQDWATLEGLLAGLSPVARLGAGYELFQVPQ